MTQYGPRPRLILTNRLHGSTVGYECVAQGCTWRSVRALRSEAETAFAKHVEKAHNRPLKQK